VAKVIIRGTGDYCVHFLKLHCIPWDDIVAFTDQDKGNKEEFLGKPIIDKNDIFKYKWDFILIASKEHFQEIRSDLLANGKIAMDKIMLIDDYACRYDNRIQMNIQKGSWNNLFQKVLDAGQLPEDRLGNCKVLVNREAVLRHMPFNAICAEIGVAYGDFSEKIMKELKPKKFYAIDYFNRDDPYKAIMNCDYFARDNMPHQKWYNHRFKEEIEKGIMEVKQGLSWDALEQFEDDYFDYVYLDASHDYENVQKDIRVLEKKVKNGGYIQFNDYTLCFPDAFLLYSGVIPAVNEFINLGKHIVSFYCLAANGCNDIVVKIVK